MRWSDALSLGPGEAVVAQEVVSDDPDEGDPHQGRPAVSVAPEEVAAQFLGDGQLLRLRPLACRQGEQVRSDQGADLDPLHRDRLERYVRRQVQVVSIMELKRRELILVLHRP